MESLHATGETAPSAESEAVSGTTRVLPPPAEERAAEVTRELPRPSAFTPPTDPADLAAGERLRERLWFFNVVLAVLFACLLALGASWVAFPANPAFRRTGRLMLETLFVCVGVFGGIALYLGRTDVRGRALLGCQWLMLGTAIAFCVWFQVMKVYDNQDGILADLFRQHPVFAALAFSYPWQAFLICYGTFIPHDWRRLAAQAGLIVLAPVFINAGIRALDTETGRHLTGAFTFSMLIFLGFAAACVVYASYHENALRRDVIEAKKVGPYRIGAKLGEGGMGVVYRAEHRLLKRPCAIKFVRPEVTGDPGREQRFFREFQAMARLSHWNLVEVFDYGRAASGAFYYVMEYLDGLSLEQLVRAHGPLPPGRAAYLLRQACAALRQAHALGLVHRDIKPSNVLVTEKGGAYDVVKVLDFGLVLDTAHALDDQTLTRTGVVMGTPGYMAPEQANGPGRIDARGDLYSLGAVGHFLLTGRPPFTGSFGEVLSAQLAADGIALDSWGGEAGGLPAVLGRCLRRDPAERYATVDELVAALDACGCAGGWSAADAEQWWKARAAAGPGA
jgi:hypothetical protein